MAALANVGYRCSDLRWCYLEQTVHFFQSDPHAVIPNKLAFPSARSPIILWRLWSYKPSHKHDSNKHQSKALFCNLRPQIRWNTRSVTHVNKAYLIWLMFRVLSNQHYQHRANRKLSSWAIAVFQNRGVCGQAFLHSPPPPLSFPFFFSRGNAWYAGYSCRRLTLVFVIAWWCRLELMTENPRVGSN